MNKYLKTGAALLMAGMLTIACEAPASQAVIVELGDEQVTVDEFYLYIRQVNPLIQFAVLPQAEQQRLLDDYVSQRVFAASARDQALHENPVVAARLRFFERRVLAEAFTEKSAENIEIKTSEVRAYYDKNKALYAIPAEYLIEHLVYKEPDKAIYAQSQLREGRPYAELARQRENDTDLVFVERNSFAADVLLPELREPVGKLAAGQVTELVYTNYGYHVIRLVEKDEATFKPFQEVSNEITARLQQAKAGQKLKDMVEGELANGAVRVHLDALRSAGAL